jgi:hypothetical protein
VGSDELGKVVSEYHKRSFGFASGNFFTELLAAIEVERDAKKYFGPIERAKPLDAIEVSLPDYVSAPQLMKSLKIAREEFWSLNPGLTEKVRSGSLFIPAHYLLRLPWKPGNLSSGETQSDKASLLKEFWNQYAEIPAGFKLKSQPDTNYGKRLNPVKKRVGKRVSFRGGSHYVFCRHCRGFGIRKNDLCKKDSSTNFSIE